MSAGPDAMHIVRSIAALRQQVGAWRRDDRRIGLVPTMGALHAGHLALVEAARAQNDRVVVSIFVNPKQFGPAEDLAAYPRDDAADLEKLRRAGVDLAFLPPVAAIYPEGFATLVRVTGLNQGLCGAQRPGHFDGVATVVGKLLIQCLPDTAYFGEKDYQQLMIVRRLVRDLDIPATIVAVPTVREPDGLALSSRNAYLTPAERSRAAVLAQVLGEAAAALARRPDTVAATLAAAEAELRAAGFVVDYVEIREAETLAPVAQKVTAPSRILAAIRLGRTRLIDNMPVLPAPPA